MKAANQVTFNADQRVTDLFAKSGTNVDSASSPPRTWPGRGRDRYHHAEKDTNYPAKNAGRQDRDGIVLGYQGL
ncbi:MAG: hypothetical protein ACLS6O_00595 [Bifidobacterium sp.]